MLRIDVADLIKEKRRARGLDQLTVCKLAQVSQKTLSDMESGNANPTLKSVENVFEVLGIRIK
ncbi:MAG: helix-turn-helix transcriptional regulator [Verrucomicrobiota bacterium]